MSNKKNILYLSYDGLADQLANSQILPYVDILNSFFNVFILTCEKKNNIKKLSNIQNELNKKSIKYFYLHFSKKLFFLTIFKIYDLIKIFLYLILLIKKNNIKIIHARGHIPAYVCLFVSFFFDIKYTFDFRGLWVEERIDNKSLNTKNILGKIIFRVLKYLETKTLQKAFKIIVLTEKLNKEFLKKYRISSTKIFVMPCYVNTDFFKKKSNDIKFNIFQDLKIPNDSKIICYIGSLGGFYLIDEMLTFFSKIKKNNDNYFFLIITKNIDELNRHLLKIKSKKVKQHILTKNLEFDEIPKYLTRVNISIFFIKNSKARLGTFPIKFAESLASGIPIICNTGIGDLTEHFNKFDLGRCIDLENNCIINNTILKISDLEKINKKKIFEYAKTNFSIKIAYDKYKQLYKDFI